MLPGLPTAALFAASSLALPATDNVTGEVEEAGGDYELVEIEVPEGTVELEIVHETLSGDSILDWGVWDGSGFRGWSGGLVDPIVIGEESASRGYLPGPIEPGTWTIVIGKARLEDPPVGYEIEVEYRDEATLEPREREPFEAVVLDDDARWYRGDFHVHSLESGDATAELEEIVELARERGLDFVVVTDHNTVSQVERLAAVQRDVDDVLLMRGIEVTTYAGHGNALGVGEYVDHRVGLDGRTIGDVIGDVRDQGGLFSISHPSLTLGDLCIGCAWEYEDTPWELVDAIEIHTGPYDIAPIFVRTTMELWEDLADSGHALAAIGGSDDHRAGVELTETQAPIGEPTTLVWAEELSEAAILEGVNAGRTIVNLSGPSDPELGFEVESDAARAEIGETIAAGTVEVRARARGADGLRLALHRNGRVEETVAIEGDDHEEVWSFETSPEGERYRVELRDGSLPRVASSHIFVDAAPGGCGGCGAAGLAGGAPALVLVLGALVRVGRGGRARAQRSPN